MELYYGPLDANGNIIQPSGADDGQTERRTARADHRYVGAIVANCCGQQGFAIRVLPKYPNVELRMEPGLIRWG